MSFLGTVFKGVVGFATGGPAGALAALGSSLVRRPQITPSLPFAPQGIYTQPGGNKPPAGQGQYCPPGTACSGASYDGLCVGTCVPIGGGGTQVIAQPGTSMVACRGRGGTAVMVAPAMKGFHWNTARYHVFGDCRTGTQAGDVERCTRLVRNRRINPANGHAARRAARRLNATLGLLRSIERTVQHTLGKRRTRPSKRASGRAAACGCGSTPCRCR